ncbi:MAG: phage major capsid protein [Holosporaceae bacterium]|jgi:HK97 family phage major capsid protein|nr:phage major capsid protein [Holosporaceae bacterium]
MNKDIDNAISELNNTVDELIKSNEMKIRKTEINMTKNNTNKTMPLSENLNGDFCAKFSFGDYIRKGKDDFLKKSLSDSDDSCGTLFIPQEIALRINEKLKYLSPMRAIAKIVTVSSNAVELLTDHKMPDAGWVARHDGEREETDSPEIQKIKIPAHEIYAKPKVSQKLLDDSLINVEEWLISKVAEKIAALENDAFINGSGQERPLGFLKTESEEGESRNAGTLRHFCSGAPGAFTDNDSAINILIDMTCALRPIYAKNAKWIMSRSALAEIRKLRNQDGTLLWQPSFSEASPSTLLGYPVIIDDDMPALVNENESTSIAFGDFYSGYQIVDRQGLKILRDPYTSKPFVEFYITKRTGGAVTDFDAINLLKFK